jgi:hypothetical protein
MSFLIRFSMSGEPDLTPTNTRRRPERWQVWNSSSVRRMHWSARMVAAQVKGRRRRMNSSAIAITRGVEVKNVSS